MQTNRHGKLKGLVKLRRLSKFKIYGLDNDQNICNHEPLDFSMAKGLIGPFISCKLNIVL